MFTYDQKNKMRDCIIVDIDGTIAQKHPDRNIFDYTKVCMDLPIHPVINIVFSLAQKNSQGVVSEYRCRSYASSIARPGYTIIFMSGRECSCRDQTMEWIERQHCIKGLCVELYMRKTGDYRDDTIVKRGLYENYIKNKFNVVAVFDDRPKVLRMWRELGLFTFNVAQHENEF